MKTLVLITSVICTPNIPLSYIDTRSIHSHEERYQQTKKTIETIKEKIPSSKIFIVECSNLNQEQNDYLNENCDYFLNLYENENIRNNVYSKSKSLGEGIMTYIALETILSNSVPFDKLIKISGRYWLSENFNYANFNCNNIVIKYIDGNTDNVFTALYQLPKVYVVKFRDFLKNNFDKMHKCVGYENLFASFIQTVNTQPIYINPIGLSGFVSVSRDFYNG